MKKSKDATSRGGNRGRVQRSSPSTLGDSWMDSRPNQLETKDTVLEIPSFSDFASRTEQGSETSITSKGDQLDKKGHRKDLAGTLLSITENIDTMPGSSYIHNYFIEAPWYRNFRSIFLVSDNPKIHRAAFRSSVSVFIERSRHLSTFPNTIHPYSNFRFYWEIALTIFLLLTLVVEPVRMTFYPIKMENEADHVKISLVITIVFILDIILNFSTGWVNPRNDTVNLDQSTIAKYYLRSWFIIDFLSTIPFDLLYILIETGRKTNPVTRYSHSTFHKIVRILELFKLFRLPRVIRYLKRIQLARAFYTTDGPTSLHKEEWHRRSEVRIQPMWPWQDGRSRSDSSSELPCYTPSGEQGHCSDIRQCYPSLFSDTADKFENQAMIETLKSISGPCDTSHYGSFRVDLPDGLICCVNKPPVVSQTTMRPKPIALTPTSLVATPKSDPFSNDSLPTHENKLFVPDAVAALLYQQRLPACGYLNDTLYKDEPRLPWIVALVGGHGHFCSGSLIDRYHVLTAAQCVNQLSSEDISNMCVFLGDYKLHTTSDGPAVIRKVARVIFHRSFSPETLKNDIALLKFKLPAPIGTPKVLPICLPDDKQRRIEVDEKFGVKATLAGWGRSWNPSPTPILRRTFMTIWTNDNCRIKYGYLAKNGISENMLCAVTDGKGRTDVTDCIGDSGGPLTTTGEDGISRQVGIVSWNIGCANFPYVYTRLSSFLDWIDKNVRRR